MNAVNLESVKVQGHGGITYAGTITVRAEAYNTLHLVSSYTFWFINDKMYRFYFAKRVELQLLVEVTVY